MEKWCVSDDLPPREYSGINVTGGEGSDGA